MKDPLIKLNDGESFRYLKRKKGAKVWRLQCGHFVDVIVLLGIEKKCSCRVCNIENPEPKEIIEIPTTNSYLCWDCQYHWIGDIASNRCCWGEGYLQCHNCGAINIIRAKRTFPNNWVSLRHECFKRDNYTCVECGNSNKNSTLHCDHIISVAQGGSDELDNLQTLCEPCNLAKSDKCWEGNNNGEKASQTE